MYEDRLIKIEKYKLSIEKKKEKIIIKKKKLEVLLLNKLNILFKKFDTSSLKVYFNNLDSSNVIY